MLSLSDRVERIPATGIRKIFDLAATLDGVVSLAVGEPSFDTPAHIVAAAHAATAASQTKHTANHGSPALRAAIAAHYAERWDRPVAAPNVIATAGGVTAIMLVCQALVDAGDEVLVPDPSWPNFELAVKLAGGTPVRYPLRADRAFLPDLDEIERLITPRTRLLMVNSPSNPTGAVFPADTIRGLVEIAHRHDLALLSDEMYEEFIFTGEHIPAARYDRDGRVVTISGFSKTYAMTGWRLGFAIGAPHLITAMAQFVEPIYSCPSAISQAAGVAALAGPRDAIATMREAYRRRRDLVADRLGPLGLMPVVPDGAFYAMLDFRRSGIPSRDLARQLLLEERVAVAPGSAFGDEAEGMVRVALCASDEELEIACERIARFAARVGALAPQLAGVH